MRTIKELLADICIQKTEVNSFRTDVWTFLAEFTGSQENVLSLSVPDIKRLSARFIDSDHGRVYFPRREPGNEWNFNVTRSQTESFLTDLIRHWIKNKKVTIQKNDFANMLQDCKTVPATKPTTTSNNPSIAPYLQRKPVDLVKRCKSPAIDLENDAEYLSDIPFDQESLPDTTELLKTPTKILARRKILDDWSPESTPEPQPEDQGAVIERVIEPDGVGRVQAVTPMKSMQTGLPSPPVTSPKRKHAEIETVDLNVEAQKKEGEIAKKVRLHFENQTNRSGGTEARAEPKTGPTEAPPVAGEPLVHQPLPTPLSAPPVIPVTGTEEHAEHEPSIHYVALSKTGSLSSLTPFTEAALCNIPARILDYIRKCEKTNLNKANNAMIGQDERKKYRERGRLFRDLLADVESRVLSMAHQPAKVEEENHDGDTQQLDCESSQPEISSYALWD